MWPQYTLLHTRKLLPKEPGIQDECTLVTDPTRVAVIDGFVRGLIGVLQILTCPNISMYWVLNVRLVRV